jgi:hypothetical protein
MTAAVQFLAATDLVSAFGWFLVISIAGAVAVYVFFVRGLS